MNAVTELEQLAGSVLVCGFQGTGPPREVRSWLDSGTVAGLILFKRNIEDVPQAADLIASCTITSDPDLPLLMGVDQEGGRVARFGDPIITLPPMRELAGRGDSELTKAAGHVLARQLRSLGINLNFAPVLDVDTNPANPIIGDRAFGRTAEVVIEHALAFADGLHSGGVLACGKHFPGHGDTDLDSHLALPVLRHDRARLDAVELAPFRAAVGRLPSVMTAHVVFEALDSAPATLSAAVVSELLREQIGYDGAIFTDDLEMKAVSAQHPVEESGVLAIEAGCDILLVCSDTEAAEALRGTLAREAERHVSFREKLSQARARVERLRREAANLPVAVSPEEALGDELTASVMRRLSEAYG